MKSYLNYSGVAVLAHRGGSIESFENTIESFYYSYLRFLVYGIKHVYKKLVMS